MSILGLTEKNEEAAGGKIYGVVIGIVTNNQDPEKMGRVKVNFPTRGKNNQSDWIRIATLMAGGDRGSIFIPEVGDEVLVGFEEGHIKSPYILGALWNGKDRPPGEDGDENNSIRKIKSRSGHEIIFDDSERDRKEKVIIRSKSGHSIILDDTQGGEKIRISDKSGKNTVEIDSVKRSITLQSDASLKIKSKVIEIEAEGELSIMGRMVRIN